MIVTLLEPRFKAVLFDLDGTLIEFKFPVKKSRRALFDFLRRSKFDVNRFTETMRTQDLIDAVHQQWTASRNPKSQPFDDVKSSLYRILDQFEYKSMSTARPFANSLYVIQKIRRKGGIVGIVTNSGRGPVQAILENNRFLPFVSLVITRNEMGRMKPSPDGLLEAKRILGLETQDILYVGDSVLDIESAKSAKITCASIPTGIHRADELRNLSPDYMLERLSDIEKLVIPAAR